MQLLESVEKGSNLGPEEAAIVFGQCFEHGDRVALLGRLLTALAKKGETAEEIFGVVRYLRSRMRTGPMFAEAIDTCGTGGDNAQTINASTMSAFLCAAAGVKVAKHGNRAATSRCGSFDLLEALGININPTDDQITKCYEETGLTFLFAPSFHPVMKEIAPIRKALGIRTIMNCVGPLLNPAGVRRQVIGVSDVRLSDKLGPALISLGSERAVIVHGLDGLDEVSVADDSIVSVFETGRPLRRLILQVQCIPGIVPAEIRGGGPEENARRAESILAGEGSTTETAFVASNAALALFAAGQFTEVGDGIEMTRALLRSGAAHKVLQKIRSLIPRKEAGK